MIINDRGKPEFWCKHCGNVFKYPHYDVDKKLNQGRFEILSVCPECRSVDIKTMESEDQTDEP